MAKLGEAEVTAGVALLGVILPPFARMVSVPTDDTLAGDTLRLVANLSADLRAATRSDTLAQDLAAIIDGWQRAQSDTLAALDHLARTLRTVRGYTFTSGTTAALIRARQFEDEIAVLVEALTLAAVVRLMARTTPRSRGEADAWRAAIVPAFDAAIDRASLAGANETVRALRTALGVFVRDMIERGRPLSRVVTYRAATELPKHVLAHLLYQDAGRADELLAENPGHNPAFMPREGRAFSKARGR